jgi:hypothetical protein
MKRILSNRSSSFTAAMVLCGFYLTVVGAFAQALDAHKPSGASIEPTSFYQFFLIIGFLLSLAMNAVGVLAAFKTQTDRLTSFESKHQDRIDAVEKSHEDFRNEMRQEFQAMRKLEDEHAAALHNRINPLLTAIGELSGKIDRMRTKS